MKNQTSYSSGVLPVPKAKPSLTNELQGPKLNFFIQAPILATNQNISVATEIFFSLQSVHSTAKNAVPDISLLMIYQKLPINSVEGKI